MTDKKNEIDPKTGMTADGRTAVEVEAAGLTPVLKLDPPSQRTLEEIEAQADELKMKNPNPDSLFVGKPSSWDKRPRQSGMEQKHAAWVLATSNFLTAIDIPVINRDQQGNRIGGRAGVKEIPERLNLALRKYAELGVKLSDGSTAVLAARGRARKAELKLTDVKAILTRAFAAVANGEQERGLNLIDGIIEEPDDPTKTQRPPRTTEPDERGVRKVRIDVREALIMAGFANLTHDLAPDERICPTCWGITIGKAQSSYRLGKIKPGEEYFPYAHEWIVPCPNCYMGKVKICEFCDKDLPRSRTICDCTQARELQAERRFNKETERRKHLPKIKLADYQFDMLYADDADKFVSEDAIDEHLEEHPEETFFGCKESLVAAMPSARDIIDMIEEQAADAAGPDCDADLVDFGPGSEEQLDGLLKTWAEENMDPRTLWFPDMSTVVEVKRAD